MAKAVVSNGTTEATNVNRLDPGNVTTVPVVVTVNHSAKPFGREEK